MKTMLLIIMSSAIILLISGCDNGLSGNTHNNISAQNVRSAVFCPSAGCTQEEVHQYNGVYYSGHHNNDGHGHNGLRADNICNKQNCEETALHSHDGRHYAGHNNSCGHDNHNRNHK